MCFCGANPHFWKPETLINVHEFDFHIRTSQFATKLAFKNNEKRRYTAVPRGTNVVENIHANVIADLNTGKVVTAPIPWAAWIFSDNEAKTAGLSEGRRSLLYRTLSERCCEAEHHALRCPCIVFVQRFAITVIPCRRRVIRYQQYPDTVTHIQRTIYTDRGYLRSETSGYANLMNPVSLPVNMASPYSLQIPSNPHHNIIYMYMYMYVCVYIYIWDF